MSHVAISSARVLPFKSGVQPSTLLGGTPAAMSVALAALARQPDGKLPLVPSGTLTQRRIASMDITSGKKMQTVDLLALTGIGFGKRLARGIEGHAAIKCAALLAAIDEILQVANLAAFAA